MAKNHDVEVGISQVNSCFSPEVVDFVYSFISDPDGAMTGSQPTGEIPTSTRQPFGCCFRKLHQCDRRGDWHDPPPL
ncbi:UNVERIFIED_CONTAM: hypothetical protein Slati_1997200 [Sesamum latifolium]|uniref:Uncharacterized protein n=1 Tax=Sesamum latifolium TaxID=2727402 RepID=A0AAW2WMZ5_9LAMI